jgi:hypothetical membrane protein
MGSRPVRADEAAPATAGATGRLAALGGVVGPAAFVVAWVAASAIAPAHSAMDDAISELAAVGADTRALMTSGFVAFALCVFAYAIALRSTLGGGAWITAAGTGFATLLVAAIPLGRSEAADHGHGIVAVCGYALLAITPLLAMRPLLVRGQRRAARLSAAAAAVSATALLLSDLTPLTGLFQRIGLTAGQGWIVASAVAMALGRLQPVPASDHGPFAVVSNHAARADASG